MTEIVYITLSHFNPNTRNYFLREGGYSSLIDYELSTENSLFELTWNNKCLNFVVETGRLESADKQQYFSMTVPFSSLSFRVKEYLYSRFLTGSKFNNFEEYYLNNVITLPNIAVFVPYKYKLPRLSKKIPDLVVEVLETGERRVYEQKTAQKLLLDKFTFKLNKKTNNSYILSGPANDKSQNSSKYSSTGWQLFESGSPIFYRESLGGFVVSKKYRDMLIELGAKEN